MNHGHSLQTQLYRVYQVVPVAVFLTPLRHYLRSLLPTPKT